MLFRSGRHTSDAWSLRGCQLQTIGFNLALGKMPTLALTWQGAVWENKGPVALAAAQAINNRPFVYKAGELQAQVVGTSTRNIQCSHAFTLASALTYIPLMCANGTNTIERFIQQHTPSIGTGNFAMYFDGTSWFTIWAASTSYMLALSMVDGGLGGVMIELPNCQIGPVTPPGDAGGIGNSTVAFETGLDTDATDQTTAIRRSAMRIHIVN